MEITEGRKRKLKSNNLKKKKHLIPPKAFFYVEILMCLLAVRDIYLFCRIFISSEYTGRANRMTRIF